MPVLLWDAYTALGVALTAIAFHCTLMKYKGVNMYIAVFCMLYCANLLYIFNIKTQTHFKHRKDESSELRPIQSHLIWSGGAVADASTL